MAGLRKRSLTIAGHPTSVSLEDEFWDALAEIARERGLSVASLVEHIDAGRDGGGLSSACRLHVLAHYRGKRLRRPGVFPGEVDTGSPSGNATRPEPGSRSRFRET